MRLESFFSRQILYPINGIEIIERHLFRIRYAKLLYILLSGYIYYLAYFHLQTLKLSIA